MYFLSVYTKKYFSNLQGLPILAWQGVFLSLLDSICVGAFYFFVTYFVEDLQFSIKDAGTIISSYGLGAIVGGYSSGRMSDKFSPNVLIIFCLILQALGYLVLIKIASLNFLRFDAFILGMAAYGFITANYLDILANCQNQQQLKAINWLSTVSNLGMGISASFIGFFSDVGFKNIFGLFSGILFLTASFLLIKNFVYVNTTVEKKSLKKTDVSIVNHSKSLSLNLFIIFTVFLCGLIISQMSSTYSLYVQAIFPEKGLRAFSILFAINTIFIILFEIQIGVILNACNKLLVMGFGAFLLGFGMLVLTFKINYFEAILGCIIYSIGEILFFCMAQLLCYQKQKKGHSLGMFRTIYATSRVCGPVLGCNVYYKYGGSFVWYICTFIGIACLLGSFYFKRDYAKCTEC